MNAYPGQAALTLRQDSFACRKALPLHLMGFGVLLPSPLYWAYDIDEEKQHSLTSITTVSPATLNAHLLASINSSFTFRWIGILSHHLEFNSRERMLNLFRFPSFCFANMDQSEDGAIYSCGQSGDKFFNRLWAEKSDIRDLLHETLLSYRLLFGQSKASRKLYRKLRPFPGSDLGMEDAFLHRLCGRKQCDLTMREERERYDLLCDFPMYKNRLVLLSDALSGATPRTWKQLWHDKRNSAHWFTFWLVLIFGGMGVFLQFVQVALQLVSIILGGV
jgi:hypothetical protein